MRRRLERLRSRLAVPAALLAGAVWLVGSIATLTSALEAPVAPDDPAAANLKAPAGASAPIVAAPPRSAAVHPRIGNDAVPASTGPSARAGVQAAPAPCEGGVGGLDVANDADQRWPFCPVSADTVTQPDGAMRHGFHDARGQQLSLTLDASGQALEVVLGDARCDAWDCAGLVATDTLQGLPLNFAGLVLRRPGAPPGWVRLSGQLVPP